MQIAEDVINCPLQMAPSFVRASLGCHAPKDFTSQVALQGDSSHEHKRTYFYLSNILIEIR